MPAYANLHLRSHHLILTVALIPLLLSCNSFLLPNSADSIIYYIGAQSIAESGLFQLQGLYLRDWAPGTSYLVALPLLIGFESLSACKVMVVLSVGLSCLLLHRLWLMEGRHFPLLTCLITAYCSIGFRRGTSVFSEWPFMALIFAFLLLTPSLHARSPWWRATALGTLLGAASLVRFVGVFAGTAIVATIVGRWSQRQADRFAVLARGTLTAGVGASLFLSWRLFMRGKDAQGLTFKAHYPEGWWIEFFSHANFLTLPGKIGDLFFHESSMVHVLGELPASIILIVTGLIALFGLALRVRSGLLASDWFAVALLALFAFLSDNQQTRYLLPAMPFILDYFWSGLQALLRTTLRASRQLQLTAVRVVGGIHLLLVTGLLLKALVLGGAGTHGGLLIGLHESPASFYRGMWRELFLAGEAMKSAPGPGGFTVLDPGEQGRGPLALYLRAFSERDIAELLGEEPRFAVRASGRGALATPDGMHELWSGKHIVVFERR